MLADGVSPKSALERVAALEPGDALLAATLVVLHGTSKLKNCSQPCSYLGLRCANQQSPFWFLQIYGWGSNFTSIVIHPLHDYTYTVAHTETIS